MVFEAERYNEFVDQERDSEILRAITRRTLLRQASYGVGSLALGSLLSESIAASVAESQQAHYELKGVKPKAKSVIFLFMAGAPSQLDLLDPKPILAKHSGEPCPDDVLKGERFAFIKGVPKLLGSSYRFDPCGQSGQMISELLPHLREISDDIAVVRSMQTDQFNHAPAQIFMNTGAPIPGRPAMGSWLTYGLGNASKDLPGFVVLISGENNPDGGKACWSSGF